jgi:hypothetical protein
MGKQKLLKLIRIFFVLFILSGIGSIIDYYLGVYPHMFTKLGNLYDIVRLNHVSIVRIPAVPLILLVLTISVFVYLVRRLYKLIIAEIKKENQGD